MIESTTELQNMQCSIAERLNYISELAKKAIHFALSFPISPSVLSTSSENYWNQKLPTRLLGVDTKFQ